MALTPIGIERAEQVKFVQTQASMMSASQIALASFVTLPRAISPLCPDGCLHAPQPFQSTHYDRLHFGSRLPQTKHTPYSSLRSFIHLTLMLLQNIE
jgi:hypothetical protein